MKKLLLAGLLALLTVLLGAAVTSAQDQPTYFTLDYDGLERTYTLTVPASYDDSTPLPLLIALHPIASSGKAMAALTGFDAAAEAGNFLVAYPDSDDLTWDDGRLGTDALPHLAPVDDVGFIAALIDHISADYAVDADRVYLTGFASGGMMAYRLACALPERFAGVAVVGALLWPYLVEGCAPDSTAPVSMLVVLGQADTTYNAEGRARIESEGGPAILDEEATLAFWAERDGCDPDDIETPDGGPLLRYGGCDGGATVDFLYLAGVGSNWPRSGEYTLNQFGFDLTALLADYVDGDDSWVDAAAHAETSGDVYGGVPRTYLVYVPPQYDPAEPMPVMFALHGRPGNGGGMAYLLDSNRLARQEGFILVYPEGTNREWNYPRTPGFYDNGADDVDFLLKLRDDLALDLNIDFSHSYVMGFSNGGFMTQRVACEAGDQFAGFGVVGAGFFPSYEDFCGDSPPRPMVFIHGTRDRSVAWDGVSQTGPNGEVVVISRSLPNTLAYWAVHNHCDSSQVTQTELEPTSPTPSTFVAVFDFGGCAAPIRFYVIHEGGHNLPGTDRLDPEIAGSVNMDIHAGEVIWRFLSEHTAAE